MKRLKPCPFCGGKAKRLTYPYNGKDVYVVMCNECKSRSPMYLENAKEHAVTIWNNRVDVL